MADETNFLGSKCELHPEGCCSRMPGQHIEYLHPCAAEGISAAGKKSATALEQRACLLRLGTLLEIRYVLRSQGSHSSASFGRMPHLPLQDSETW